MVKALYRTRVGQEREVSPQADERDEEPIYLTIVRELKNCW
jgi:hypothetical protein